MPNRNRETHTERRDGELKRINDAIHNALLHLTHINIHQNTAPWRTTCLKNIKIQTSLSHCHLKKKTHHAIQAANAT